MKQLNIFLQDLEIAELRYKVEKRAGASCRTMNTFLRAISVISLRLGELYDPNGGGEEPGRRSRYKY